MKKNGGEASGKDTSGLGISQDNSHSQKEKSKDLKTNKQHPTGAVQVVDAVGTFCHSSSAPLSPRASSPTVSVISSIPRLSASLSRVSTEDSLSAETEDVLLGWRHPPPQLPVKGDDGEPYASLLRDERDYILLTETDTIMLLDIPPTMISVDDDTASAVIQRNLNYAELCKSIISSDKYVERSMQTFNGALKNKPTQSEQIVFAEKGTVATNWEIYDSSYKQNETFDGDETEHPESSGDGTSETSSTISLLSEIQICGIILNPETDPEEEILLPESLANNLFVMEKIVGSNNLQLKLAAYRQLPTLEDSDRMVKHGKQREEKDEKSLAPTLELLWAFSCELTRGYCITSMTWNKQNPDILAVGYGDFDSTSLKPGLICCWTLKNIMWPERVFNCHSSVTSLEFSADNQLAVGMSDGTVAIYNISIQDSRAACIASSSQSSRRHLHPVLQVTWTRQKLELSMLDRDEVLVSVSSDGRIAKWFMGNKGLECSDLMWLKTEKESKTASESSKKKSVLTKPTALCVDFHPVDFGIYLAGTQDGTIRKSSFYECQNFLYTYEKHAGPVNHIEWSPFSPDVFLSCSSDETVQMWKQGRPVMTFRSMHHGPVFLAKWSPNWSTLFGTVMKEQVEIWDLNLSIIFPTIVHHAVPGVRLTSLLFARGMDSVLVGDSEGQVTVYKLKNLSVGAGKQVDTLDGIIQHGVSRFL